MITEKISWLRPMQAVIEAVVTNNLGFEKVPHSSDLKFGSFAYFDLRGLPDEDARSMLAISGARTIVTKDEETIDLHYHLDKLSEAKVNGFYTETDMKLPLIESTDAYGLDFPV